MQEGIYRMSGSSEDIANAKRDINKGKQVDLVAIGAKSVHTLATLLKTFFRELKPEPLLTFSLYESLMAASQIDDQDERRRILWGLLSLLPALNMKVLTVLMSHLQFVVQHKESNKMDATNLAIVFGPILCGSRNENVGVIIADVSNVIRLITYLINDCDFFFPDKHVEIIAERPADHSPASSPQQKARVDKGKEKQKEEKKEKKEEKKEKGEKKDKRQEEKQEKAEKKKRADNVKRINEDWTRLSSAATAPSPTASPSSGKRSKQEKKQEQLARKERKERQKRINERWERLSTAPGRSPYGTSTPQQRKEQMRGEKERLEGLYSQRSTHMAQRITVSEFMKERASRIKSGNYTYEELQEWTSALENYDTK